MSLKERTSITLSAQVKQDLEHLIPKNHRSQFIEQAIINALKEKQQQALFDLIDAIQPVAIDQDSAELISHIRQQGVQRVVS